MNTPEQNRRQKALVDYLSSRGAKHELAEAEADAVCAVGLLKNRGEDAMRISDASRLLLKSVNRINRLLAGGLIVAYLPNGDEETGAS